MLFQPRHHLGGGQVMGKELERLDCGSRYGVAGLLSFLNSVEASKAF